MGPYTIDISPLWACVCFLYWREMKIVRCLFQSCKQVCSNVGESLSSLQNIGRSFLLLVAQGFFGICCDHIHIHNSIWINTENFIECFCGPRERWEWFRLLFAQLLECDDDVDLFPLVGFCQLTIKFTHIAQCVCLSVPVSVTRNVCLQKGAFVRFHLPPRPQQ